MNATENEGVGTPTPEITTHYWGLGGLTHCGRNVGMYEGHAFTNIWDNINCPGCLAYKPGVGEPTPLQHFYVTFGVQYSHEPHPAWAGAHPAGWLQVSAPDEEAARKLLMEYIGNHYAFIYPEDRFDPKGDALRWYPRGPLGFLSTEAEPRAVAGLPPLVSQYGPSDCRYYGVDTNEVVAARIEGELAKDSDADAIRELGYEAELVHKHCLTEGLALFKRVTEVDSRVMAGELDYADPHECPVCETSIT